MLDSVYPVVVIIASSAIFDHTDQSDQNYETDEAEANCPVD